MRNEPRRTGFFRYFFCCLCCKPPPDLGSSSPIPLPPSKIEINTKKTSLPLQVSNLKPTTPEIHKFPYLCPICFQYYNKIYKAKCCGNFVCDLCIQIINQKIAEDSNLRPSCFFCKAEHMKLIDVEPSDASSNLATKLTQPKRMHFHIPPKSPSKQSIESPPLSPFRIKPTSAVNPSLGDSVIIQNLEIQFSDLKDPDSLARSQTPLTGKPYVRKMSSFESMRLPEITREDPRKRSTDYFVSEADNMGSDRRRGSTIGMAEMIGSWKKQLKMTFHQIEHSLIRMKTLEGGKSLFQRIVERLLCRKRNNIRKNAGIFSKSASPGLHQDQGVESDMVDVLIKRHIEFLGHQSHVFQTQQGWLKAVLLIVSDFLQAILSLMSCVLYVLSTYFTQEDNPSLMSFIHTCDYVITALFSYDLLRHFLVSKNKLRFFLSMHCIIDVLAIMPIYLQLLLGVEQTALGFLHMMQIFRLVRILRLYRLFKEYEVEGTDKIDNSLNDTRFSLQKQLAVFLCSIFALLFISAGMSYELDGMFGQTYTISKFTAQGQTLTYTDLYTFFYAFYLMFQTMFSMGYGDVVASTSSSRILVSLLVLLFIYVIVDQAMKLYEVRSKTSPWDYEYRQHDHVVIAGFFTENSLLRVLQELFKLEDERRIRHVLLLRNIPPSVEIINLMQSPNFEDKVSYLQCNLLSEAMIVKANLRKCREIFLVNESPSVCSYQQDKMLTALMNLIQECFPFTPKIMRVSDPEIARRSYGYLSHWTPWNKLFSTVTMKQVLMVENLFNKGFSTIFSNFFCSNRLLSMHKGLPNVNWYMEYGASLLQEIFCVEISSYFHGMGFSQAVQVLTRSKSTLNSEGVLLIGVKTSFTDEEYDIRDTILINPQNYAIKPGDKGLVIATNQQRAGFLTYFDLEATDPKMVPLYDEDIQLETRKEAILREFDNMKAANNYYSLGRLLSKEFLLWKEDISGKISGHIILFYAENIYENVIQLLRARTKKPIVYYTDTPPDEHWRRFSARFPNVFYAQGDILDITQLRNSGIVSAFHVCIFTPIATSGNESNAPECLLLANLLDEYFNVPYTIETNDHNDLKFLGNKPIKHIAELGVQFYPKYMAGEAYVLSVLDYLVAFTSGNHISLDVFIHMFVHNENQSQEWDYNPMEEDQQNKNANIRENLRIMTIACPEPYRNKCYQDLLIDFCSLRPSIIPIGILTSRYTVEKKERSSSIKKLNNNVSINYFQDKVFEERINQSTLPSPLALTNPLPTTILNETDRIILIGDYSSFDIETVSPGLELRGVNCEDSISIEEENGQNNKQLMSLMKLSLTGKKKIIRKIEEKNNMIRNLMEEIEKKKQGYARFVQCDKG